MARVAALCLMAAMATAGCTSRDDETMLETASVSVCIGTDAGLGDDVQLEVVQGEEVVGSSGVSLDPDGPATRVGFDVPPGPVLVRVKDGIELGSADVGAGGRTGFSIGSGC